MAERFRYSDGKTGVLLSMSPQLEAKLRKKSTGAPSPFHRKGRAPYREKPENTPRACEAPAHAEGCNGRGNTKDHFTPKVILRELRKLDPNRKYFTQIQRLSHACHDAKDKSTQHRASQVRDQLRGASLILGDHLTEMPRLEHHNLSSLQGQNLESLEGAAIHTGGYATLQRWHFVTSTERNNVYVENVYSFTSPDGSNTLSLFVDMPYETAKENPVKFGQTHWYNTNATVRRIGDEFGLFAHTLTQRDDDEARASIVHIGRPEGESTIFVNPVITVFEEPFAA
jgi:hypothetical protein